MFRLQPNGFTNHDLRALTAELRGLDPAAVTAGQITYDLRRLRCTASSPASRTPTATAVTDHGLHTAMFLSAVHDRFLPTGLAHLADSTPPHHCAPPPAPTTTPSTTSPHNRSRRLTPTTDPTHQT